MTFSIQAILALLATLPVAALAAAEDLALAGCWRSQHIQVTLSDQTHRDQNGDCVGEYDGKRARARCHSETGETEALSSYEAAGPGRLRVVPLDTATGQPKGTPSELRYRIDGDWLLIERPLTAAAPAANNNTRQLVSLRSMSIRVAPGADGKAECRPRGPSRVRIGRTPVSSLALTAPAGWEPLLVDPATDGRLGPAVNSSFLIGAFVPKGTAAASISQLVLVLDDVRFGPVPVRSAEFAGVKKRLAGELGAAALACDLPDRACASLRTPEGSLVYTELVNVKGRVAMINGTVARAQAGSLPLVQLTVRAFVDQLKADNAK